MPRGLTDIPHTSRIRSRRGSFTHRLLRKTDRLPPPKVTSDGSPDRNPASSQLSAKLRSSDLLGCSPLEQKDKRVQSLWGTCASRGGTGSPPRASGHVLAGSTARTEGPRGHHLGCDSLSTLCDSR